MGMLSGPRRRHSCSTPNGSLPVLTISRLTSWPSLALLDDKSMSGLTSDQITQFKEQGYLLLPDFIDPAVFQPLIHEFEGIIDSRARQAQREGRLIELFEGEPFDRRLAW